MKIRYVTVKGVVYLRTEDVVEYVRDLAATQDTDTRHYLEEAAVMLQRRARSEAFDDKVRKHGYVDRVSGQREHDPSKL